MANPTRELTARQREIYEFIRHMIVTRGYGPTVREIGLHCGIRSPNGVTCHLIPLEKKGFIKREANLARAIQLTQNPVEELVQTCERLLKDWRAGNIAASGKASAAKAASVAETFDSLRSQVREIQQS